MRKKISWC